MSIIDNFDLKKQGLTHIHTPTLAKKIILENYSATKAEKNTPTTRPGIQHTPRTVKDSILYEHR